LIAALHRPAHALLLRHAYAPGFGDPAHFRMGDCNTQRNLDQRGRAEARAIGQRLRQAGIAQARVLSSEWCRCTETARLLGLGPVKMAPALSSFFARPDEGAARLAATRKLIAETTRAGGPVVMVTHDVTIAGLTGERVATGDGAVVRLEDGELRLVGILRLAERE
jgi:phosphohistidine phosphatase SixA